MKMENTRKASGTHESNPINYLMINIKELEKQEQIKFKST